MNRLAGRLARMLLLAPVVVLGHELVLWVGHGPGASLAASLRATGHGTAWVLTAAAILLAALAAGIAVAGRIGALRRRLQALAARLPSHRRLDNRALASRWWWSFGLSVIGFLLLENAEHATAHGHLPLLEPLIRGQYVATIPIFGVLSLLAAALSLVVHGRLRTLEVAVRRAERLRLPRAPRAMLRPPRQALDLRAVTQVTAGSWSRRAPPRPV
jgi:hypothetical protein